MSAAEDGRVKVIIFPRILGKKSSCRLFRKSVEKTQQTKKQNTEKRLILLASRLGDVSFLHGLFNTI